MQGKLMAGARGKAGLMKPFTATNPYECIEDSCGITVYTGVLFTLFLCAMKVTSLSPSVRKTLQSFHLSPDGKHSLSPKDYI